MFKQSFLITSPLRQTLKIIDMSQKNVTFLPHADFVLTLSPKTYYVKMKKKAESLLLLLAANSSEG